MHPEDSLSQDPLAIGCFPRPDVDPDDPGRALFPRTVERQRVGGSVVHEGTSLQLERRVKHRNR